MGDSWLRIAPLALGFLLGACGASSSDSDGGDTGSSSQDDGGLALDAEATDAASCAVGFMNCGSKCLPTIAPTAESLHASVFLPSCATSASCHTGSNPKDRLGLTTVDDVMKMLGKASCQRSELDLVEPGQRGQSYLVNKLRGVDLSARSCGGNLSSVRMPRMAPQLCEEILGVVETWIDNGAPRN